MAYSPYGRVRSRAALLDRRAAVCRAQKGSEAHGRIFGYGREDPQGDVLRCDAWHYGEQNPKGVYAMADDAT